MTQCESGVRVWFVGVEYSRYTIRTERGHGMKEEILAAARFATVSKRLKSVWVFGEGDVTAEIADPNSLETSTSQGPFLLYCVPPITDCLSALQDERVLGILSPAASPFSHDANLLRSIAHRTHRPLALGTGLVGWSTFTGQMATLSPETGSLRIGRQIFTAEPGVSGSDEAVGISLSDDWICYRPHYLYDKWLGDLLAIGLRAGVGELVTGRSSESTLDDAGRVWLRNGPSPSAIADWILVNWRDHCSMMLELIRALTALSVGTWNQPPITVNPSFLDAFSVNCRVAPFVAFPLFALTERASEGGHFSDLQVRVAQVSCLVSAEERQERNIPMGTLHQIEQHVEGLLVSGCSLTDVVASTVLLSDVRRIVIDRLRREYPDFLNHTRHRLLQL